MAPDKVFMIEMISVWAIMVVLIILAAKNLKQEDMRMKNISEGMRVLLDEKGNLPAYAWPGGYPLFYMDSENNVLCPECANKNDEYDAPIVAHDANYEDASLYCEHCSKRIESAYNEKE